MNDDEGINETPAAPEPAAPEAAPGWRFNELSLTILPDIEFEEWVQLWSTVDGMQRNISWYIGDALNFAEARWGERYASVLDAYAPETRSSAKWVASKIEPARRRKELSFSHHKAVAALEPDQQDEFLQKAIDESLKSSELERLVREAQGKPYRPRKQQPYPSNNPPESVSPIVGPVNGPIIDVGEDSARNPEGESAPADPRLPEWLEERPEVVGLVKRPSSGPAAAPVDPPTLAEELREMISRTRILAPRVAAASAQEPWTVTIAQPPAPKGFPREWVVELRRAPDHLAIGMGPSLGIALCEASLSAAMVDLGEDGGE